MKFSLQFFTCFRDQRFFSSFMCHWATLTGTNRLRPQRCSQFSWIHPWLWTHGLPERGVARLSSFAFKATGTEAACSEGGWNTGANVHDFPLKTFKNFFRTSETYKHLHKGAQYGTFTFCFYLNVTHLWQENLKQSDVFLVSIGSRQEVVWGLDHFYDFNFVISWPRLQSSL